MKIMYQTISVVIMSMELVLMTGCVNPDGTQNNTAGGALIGGAVGAITGAAIGGPRNRGADALIGAAAGLIAGGLIGHWIDQEHQQRLQQQSPQTWNTITNNEEVVQQQSSQTNQPPDKSQTTATLTPLTVDDVKALTAAGVNTNAIIHEIEISQSKYSPQDITAAQQASPPVAPAVIAYMQGHPS